MISEGRTILACRVGGWFDGVAADKFVSVEEAGLDSGGVSFCCSSLGRRLLDMYIEMKLCEVSLL